MSNYDDRNNKNDNQGNKPNDNYNDSYNYSERNGQNGNNQNGPNNPKKKKPVGLIITVIVLAILVALLVVFISGKDSDKKKDTKKVSSGAVVSEIVKPTEEPTSKADGGGDSDERNLTSEDREIFDKATGSLAGVSYEPLKVSTQVVNGTKYRFYCKSTTIGATEDTKYVNVNVFVDTSGNVELGDIEDVYGSSNDNDDDNNDNDDVSEIDGANND